MTRVATRSRIVYALRYLRVVRPVSYLKGSCTCSCTCWCVYSTTAPCSSPAPTHPTPQLDVLVTHTPPAGYGDLTRGSHVGDKQLLAAVQVGGSSAGGGQRAGGGRVRL